MLLVLRLKEAALPWWIPPGIPDPQHL